MVGLATLMCVLACARPQPSPGIQRLCAAGGSTDGWLASRLAEADAETVANEVMLGAPTVLCHDGREETIELTWIHVERSFVEDGRVKRRQDWFERGEEPSGSRTSSLVVEHDTEPTSTWTFAGRERR